MSEPKPKQPADVKTVLMILAFFGVTTFGSLTVFAKKLAWFAVKDEVVTRDSVMMAERKKLVREQRDVNNAVMWQLVLLEECIKNMDPKAYRKAQKEMDKWKTLRPSFNTSTGRNGVSPPLPVPLSPGRQPTTLFPSDSLSSAPPFYLSGRAWPLGMP